MSPSLLVYDEDELYTNPDAQRMQSLHDTAATAEASSTEGQAKGEPEVAPGSLSSSATIYKITDRDGNINWTSEQPGAAEAAENDETARHAIVIRNRKSSDSRRQFEAESLVIQSLRLKDALEVILAGYPGVSCRLTRLVFDAPFKPFMHRWTDLCAYAQRPDLDDTTKEHLLLLQAILKIEMAESIEAYEDYLSHGITSYEHAWMFFPPACIVVSEAKGTLSAYELGEVTYNEQFNVLQLRTHVIDWNGKTFGRFMEYLVVPGFKGTQSITSLPVYPLAFHKQKDEVRTMLINRGKKFEALVGHHFRVYNGTAITWDRERQPVHVHHKGRIVVDCKAFGQHSPFGARNVGQLMSNDLERTKKKDTPPDSLDALRKPTSTIGDKAPDYTLMDELLLLCHAFVRGYSLVQKRWLDFFVDTIEEIQWNTKAYDSLVLPADQKELVLAFAESQVENRESFDDIVEGKGKGIIILLSGTPGIGKTLTAESVAENMKRPLHTISSGDLGTSAREVEERLTKILELVARWHAVLLLDECDVFLEARSTHDLVRNSMVSTFLRTLEYYEGILFMTTNRADNLDPAFESRIHVSMQYPDLTAASRRQIWANFVNGQSGSASLRADQHALTEADLDELAQINLNGRQIKNIIKTSHLLASRKKRKLCREFIETVLTIENRRPKSKVVFGSGNGTNGVADVDGQH